MPSKPTPIDLHIARFAGAQRESLQRLCDDLRVILPGAEECISYNMPCFKVDGRAVAGFDGFKNHNSYFPHSGNVVNEVGPLPKGCSTTRGALRFPLDASLPKTLLWKLVKARLAEIAERGR